MAFGISATAWLAGAAVVGTAANVIGGNKAAKTQANAAAQADQTTRDTTAQNIEFQREQNAIARADTEPWRKAGIGALNKLTGMNDFTGRDLQNEPGYAFGLNEGMKGLTNSAAARGGLLSGAALKAASKYNSDYAGTKFNEAFSRDATNKNRLASLAGIGQTAAGQNASGAMALGSNVGSAYTNMGNNIASNQIGVGNARASSYLAQGNALTGGVNQAISMWNQSQNKPPVYGGADDWYTQSGNY